MIELDSVTKYYGTFPAITDISFRVEQGEVLGFLGPNGAGKSTTMKIITGFVPPTHGSCTVAGHDIVTESLEARRHIGYLPETVPLYSDMSVEDYLAFMGRIRGMTTEQLNRRIDDVIEICRLQEYFTTYIYKLSKGFRQRVGVAQAILHEPDVLILDEPTIGIDPIQVVETRELIRDLGGERTVIVSTHILPEVSTICERVIIIHEGQIVAIDRPENLATRLRGVERIEVDVLGPTREVRRGHLHTAQTPDRRRGVRELRDRGRPGRRRQGRPCQYPSWRWLGTAQARVHRHVAGGDLPQTDHHRRSGGTGRRRDKRGRAELNTIVTSWNNLAAIAWKELRIYFQTPTAYVVGAMFVLHAGIWFVLDVLSPTPEAAVRAFAGPSTTFFILLAPVLTMRLLAEEQKLGTMELLLTAPVRDWEVVLGKYLASVVLLIATLAMTLYYVLMIYAFGEPDSGPVMATYLGMVLYGAAALAIGMLASSLTNNQIVAAVLGIGSLSVLTFIDLLGLRFEGVAVDIVERISIQAHFADFARGVVDTSNVVYYLSMIAVFLFLSVRAIETRRWR